MTADGLSASGQWRQVGSLVPYRQPTVLLFGQDGRAAGFITQSDADIQCEIDMWCDARMPDPPDPWDVNTCSPHCSAPIEGGLICTLDPDHGGIEHEAHDTRGRQMPLPVDEMGAVA